MGTKSNDYIDVAFCTKFFENDKFLGTKSNFYIDVTFCTQILVKIYKFLGTKSTNKKLQEVEDILRIVFVLVLSFTKIVSKHGTIFEFQFVHIDLLLKPERMF